MIIKTTIIRTMKKKIKMMKTKIIMIKKTKQ